MEKTTKRVTVFRKLFTLLPCILMITAGAFAQDAPETQLAPTSGHTHFLVTGSANLSFVVTPNSDVKTNFDATGFSPIFLWKLSDKLFFEAEVEIAIEEGEVGGDIEYAKMSYVVNKYLAFGGGRMISPFGAFGERFEPSMVERFPNGPLLMHHEDGTNAVGPNGAEMGLDARGGFAIGSGKMNYTIYIANGPTLNDGSEDPTAAGQLEYENFYDNNSNKEVGARIGLLPISNSSLEIGISGSTAIAGNPYDELAMGIDYSGVRANAIAADFSYVKTISAIKSTVNLKAQYNTVSVGSADYLGGADSAFATYTFDNKSNVYYLRFSIRPSMLENGFLHNLELLVRYNSLNYPEGAEWEAAGQTNRVDIGAAYWLSWRSALKMAYEINPDNSNDNIFLMKFVTGL